MISRQWRGLAKPECAAAYIEHLHSEVFPQLVQLAGFHDAAILRRDLARGVEFIVVTVWQSLDAIHSFAGRDVEAAVVPAKVQAMMIEYDRTVRHYEVVE
jgi:heme-degrading monooxygenase HmoA